MSNSTPMAAIKRIFDKRFEAWDIVLPVESMTELRGGSIVRKGWMINYQYDSSDGIIYLDYFASHRMTNDTLNRIYADGSEELLGYCQEFFEADNEQAEREHYLHNRHFYEEVKRKGLW